MSDPITTVASALDALDEIDVPALPPSARDRIDSLRGYVRAAEGRQALQESLGQVRQLMSDVRARMDLTEPLVTRGTALLARDVELQEEASARHQGRQATGSRIIAALVTPQGVALLISIASLIAGALGYQIHGVAEAGP